MTFEQVLLTIVFYRVGEIVLQPMVANMMDCVFSKLAKGMRDP